MTTDHKALGDSSMIETVEDDAITKLGKVTHKVRRNIEMLEIALHCANRGDKNDVVIDHLERILDDLRRI